MFLDEKRQGEAQTAEQANSNLKLSEAIRRGKPLISENAKSYRLCAIGCAWAGVKGYEMTSRELSDRYMRTGAMGPFRRAIAQELGFSAELVEEIHQKHVSGWPALRIADDLQERGY